MANELVQNILGILEQTEFPTNEELNPDALKLYNAGQDILRMYRGHPDILIKAMQIFLMTDVMPYAYAGAGKVVMLASYISGSNYDHDGIAAGRTWLKKAQAVAPYHFEIDIIEAEMYNMLNQRDKFRSAIDALQDFPDYQERFDYANLELSYWSDRGDFKHIEKWANRARELAETVPQELSVLRKLGFAYWQSKNTDAAKDTYRALLKIDPGDAWTWHNLSILLLNQDYLEALECNRRALHIMEFGNAQDVQASLIQKLSRNRHDDLIDEIPSFPIKQNGAEKSNQKKGFLGRLFGGN